MYIVRRIERLTDRIRKDRKRDREGGRDRETERKDREENVSL